MYTLPQNFLLGLIIFPVMEIIGIILFAALAIMEFREKKYPQFVVAIMGVITMLLIMIAHTGSLIN